MNNKIAVLIPSFARPELFKAWYAAFKETATSGQCDVLLWNSEDDACLHEYDDIPDEIIRHIGPNYGWQVDCDELWKRHPEYSYYLTTEDDAPFVRVGWDSELLAVARNKFRCGIGVLGLRDLSNACDCLFYSGAWVKAVGSLWLVSYDKITPLCVTQVMALSKELNTFSLVEAAAVKHELRSRGDDWWNDPELEVRRKEWWADFEVWRRTELLKWKTIMEGAIHGGVVNNDGV